MLMEFLRKATHILPDKLYIALKHKRNVGKWPNFKHPATFNEKLQWLKLHDKNPEYIKMVDKHEAKKYVADIIGEEYIIPEYGVWDSFDGIPKIFQTIQNDKTVEETIDYFDTFWNLLKFRQNYPNSTNPLPKPKNLDSMIELAKKLSAGILL